MKIFLPTFDASTLSPVVNARKISFKAKKYRLLESRNAAEDCSLVLGQGVPHPKKSYRTLEVFCIVTFVSRRISGMEGARPSRRMLAISRDLDTLPQYSRGKFTPSLLHGT
jgi:hypothetical protein